MRASRRLWILVFAGLTSLCLCSLAAAQQSDQVVAARVLGPQWKQLSRRAGMIFAGTVLDAASPTSASERAVPGTAPAIELSFRIDHAIAGVEPGQVLTIHEWAGAWFMHRPMSKGQHVLLFLYPPSRLGLTSPVGGSLGQVVLDSSGKNVSIYEPSLAAEIGSRNESFTRQHARIDNVRVSVVQLERAIRSAREE